MTLQLIIMIVSLAAYLLLFILFPIKKKSLELKTGKLVSKITNQSVVKSFVILFLCFMIIGLSYLKNFRALFQIILNCCALMGEYMAIGDLISSKKNGLYENGIIANGQFVEFSTITSFPVLQLPLEEQENYDKTTLVLTTTKKANVSLIFASEEEYSAVVEEMLELHPELKTW